MQKVTILGSTGSIGCNTLNVISQHPEKFSVYALSAQHNIELLLTQCRQFKPRFAVMTNPDAAKLLKHKLQAEHIDCTVLSGTRELEQIASDPEADIVMAAIVGAAGLLSTLAAARAGKRVLLANKEALVMAGDLFMQTVRTNQAQLLPIDSEHNAIFQCFYPNQSVNKIILTASGGPFLTTPLTQFNTITSRQACAHPKWKMGQKISVDSATMLNKGLEVIEAHYLFGMDPKQIEVIIHPQSIVHSMVEYIDGSVIAELANPDMRIPIAYGLAWPERITTGVDYLDLMLNNQLDFQLLEHERFPCLALAYAALKQGGTSATILNAANEVAVQAFLANQIAFTDIYAINAATLDKLSSHPALELEQILRDDKLAREFATQLIKQCS